MVEKSIFLDKRHSPMIELTKREIKIILYWLELQAHGYWKKSGKDFDNIETIYNKLNEYTANRKRQTTGKRGYAMKCLNCGGELKYNSYYRYIFHIKNGMQTLGCRHPFPEELKDDFKTIKIIKKRA